MTLSGKVEEIKNKQNYNQITLKTLRGRVIIYDYTFTSLKIGYRIKVVGYQKEIETNHNDHEFNYNLYLTRQNIKGVFETNDLKIIKKTFGLGMIRQSAINYLDNNYQGNSKIFLKALLLGSKEDMSEEFYEILTINGVLHLFAISGLHITTLMLLLEKMFKLLNFKTKQTFVFGSCFLLLYMVITNFTPSVLRASLMYILLSYSKLKNLRFSSLDVISITFIILLMYNPYYMYSLGFVLSYTISFTIILLSPLIKKYSKVTQGLLISLSSIIVTLPITINLNNSINLLSPIINIIDIFYITTIVFPFSLILLFMPYLAIFYNFLIMIFIKVNTIFANHISINLTIGNFSFLLSFLYYFLILAILNFYFHKRLRNILIIILSVILTLTYCNIRLKQYCEAYFLDLYNGEATIIICGSKEHVVIIDTGDGTNEALSNFLIKKGIRKIEYLVLTHNHLDHNGEAELLISRFKINNIIVGAYDNSRYANLKNTIKVKTGDSFICNNYQFNILHPDNDYQDPNDDSVVILVKLGLYQFLFLGDASKNIDYKFVKNHVDVIKIAHHGSKTATSTTLIATLNPKYAIIQTTRLSKYNFPNKEVIDLLNSYQVKVYQTKINYQIKFQYFKNKCIFTSLKETI